MSVSELLTPTQTKTLWQHVAHVRLGANPNLPVQYFEHDKRKLKGVLRKLMEAGYIVQLPETADRGVRYNATEKLWDDMLSQPVDLVKVWETKGTEHYPCVFDMFQVDRFSGPEIKYLMEHADEFQWYVVDSTPFDYPNSSRFRSEAGFSEEKRGWWEGPMTMAEALARRNEVKGKGRSGITTFAVSSETLKEHIRNKTRAKKFTECFNTNIAWGLNAVGVLTDEQTDIVSKLSGDEGLFSRAVFHKDPTKWQEELREGLKHKLEKLGQLQQEITALHQINQGIQDQGGWDKFLADYKAKLAEALDKQEGEKVA